MDVQARQGLEAVKLLHHQLGPGGEGGGVPGGPPVHQIALPVVLAAFVVEGVGHLVADGGTDVAVVHRVVRLGIEEGRLQDAGGEHDLVQAGVVVGVVGDGRHLPFTPVHRPAQLGQVPVEVPGPGGQDIGQMAAAVHGQGRVILGAVGVADLHGQGVQLGQRPLPGGPAHPGQLADPSRQGGAQVVHHGQHPGLGLGREGPLHVELAQQLRHGLVGGQEHAPPSRQGCLGPLEDPAIEVEAGLVEAGAQIGGSVPDQPPAQVGSPGVQGQGGGHAPQFFHETGLADQDRFPGAQPEAAEIPGPVQPRGRGGQFPLGHAVVAGPGIPPGHPVHAGPGQPGFQNQDRGGVPAGQGRGLPEQAEHPGHVGRVLAPKFPARAVLAQVVVPLGQPQAALDQVGDGAAAVLVVLVHIEPEAGTDATPVQDGQFPGQAGPVPEPPDAGELGGQGAEAGPFDGGQIHAGGIEVPHFPAPAPLGRRSVPGGRLQDRPHHGTGAQLHLVVHPETAVLGGDDRGGEPSAHGVLVEVIARTGSGVHEGRIEAVMDHLGRQRRRQDQEDEQQACG